MAEIRCPMCGKPNPSERDTCQYCQARLKSMVDSQFSAKSDEEQGSLSSLNSDQDQGEGSMPDWLKSIRNSDFLTEPDESEPLPDWITGDTGFEEQDQSEKIEVPDWLSNLRQEGEKVQTSALSPETLDKFSFDDEPDWLRKIRVGQTTELSPDRIKPIVSDRAAPPPIEPPAQTEAEEETSEEIPDWVSELSGKSVVTSDLPALPVEKEPPVTQEEEIQFEHKEEEGSLLAWLSTLEDDETVAPQPQILPQEAEPFGATSDESVFSSELSDLFDNADSFDFNDFQFDEEAPAQTIESKEELSTDTFPKTPSPFTFEEGLEPAENLPDWLEGISIIGEEEPKIETPVEEEPEITPSTVPTWLEAYQPVETVEKPTEPPKPELVYKAGKKKLEGAGPLAGLYSVLPAEPDIAKSRKPSAITDVLDVTEKQRHQTSVFEELLSSEGISTFASEKQAFASQNIIRIILFLVLCLAIIGVRLAGINLGVISTPPAETLDAINTINLLANGSPVLFAVDYQPGYSGELEAGTSALMDQLMVKGVSLAMVSTNPTGPAQIERLISQVNKNLGHQYIENQQYITLGYIAGGITGLNAFAIQPRQIFNQGADGKPIWGTSWLNNINKVSDFSLVVVATDDPDTARAWIEQVQPHLENKPIVMVVSAQAEPMVRPYYETSPRQLTGMVTGISGGAAYEKIINRPGVATKHWSPYNAGIIIALLVIVIGSTYTLLMTLFKQRKEIAQEGRG